MMVSIAIITRGIDARLTRLTAHLGRMHASVEYEVVVASEDPSAKEPAGPETGENGESIFRIPEHRGLAYNRNRALEYAKGDVIVFIDDDCLPEEGWFAELLAPLRDQRVDAVMGSVHIPPSTFIGDSISALGFPGGGSAGFEVMFNVDEEGYTDHLSTLDCAIRKRVFERVGGFDETMTAGSEDTELSYRIRSAGFRMKYQPTAVVDHEARSNLRSFARWFFTRGRGAYQLSRRIPAGPVIARRLASYLRILASHSRDTKIVAIVPLLISSVVLQEAGFVWEAMRERL